VDEGKYVEACPKFEESLKLDPGVGTNFNLADCLERLGRTASAWGRFLDVAAASKAAGQAERERVARLRADKLEPVLARLVVRVTSPVPGLVVERDGVAIGPAAWETPVPVDPGSSAIRATAPGMRPWSQVTTVPEGPTTVSVTVPPLETLPPEKPLPSSPTVAPLQVTPVVEAPDRWSLPVVALGAVSAAAAATSVVFALETRSENQKAKALCPASVCATDGEKIEHDTLVAEAHRDRTVAYVSAGVAGAALLSAAYLFWQPFRSSKATARQSRLAFRSRAVPGAIELEVRW